MRVIVCGGRDYGWVDKANHIGWNAEEWDMMCAALHPLLDDQLVIITGEAFGADTMGRKWARENNVNYEGYPADWERYGKKAGPLRNRQMLETGVDLVVAFPGGKGTRNMVRIAQAAGVPVIEISHSKYRGERPQAG